jgi:hypothetical protein
MEHEGGSGDDCPVTAGQPAAVPPPSPLPASPAPAAPAPTHPVSRPATGRDAPSAGTDPRTSLSSGETGLTLAAVGAAALRARLAALLDAAPAQGA